MRVATCLSLKDRLETESDCNDFSYYINVRIFFHLYHLFRARHLPCFIILLLAIVLARWLERPTGIWEVMGSHPVGDS